MPYISQEARTDSLKCDINNLLQTLNKVPDEDIEGTLNFTISSLLSTLRRGDKNVWRYKWLNRAVGTLECVKLEFYRRLGTKLEEKAIAKNGDIGVYENM